MVATSVHVNRRRLPLDQSPPRWTRKPSGWELLSAEICIVTCSNNERQQTSGKLLLETNRYGAVEARGDSWSQRTHPTKIGQRGARGRDENLENWGGVSNCDGKSSL